ncbi:MAG: BrnT family toxin [Myxococcota bacterium]
MSTMTFDWDPAKNRANQKKHGLSFEDAVGVFEAEGDALELFDEKHSEFEDRFITIGPIQGGLVLVIWTERVDDIIRVISARWATLSERRLYRRHMEQRR